ncbi:MAG: DHA2 family efflux MFS transporter permease subunit [Alphaproteobacteria bacterium]|nr:DHA2 family efflux MFS transporter permease subunit [Alphaproteobacteria bacterium]MDP6829812.1 DHA2 family efflux MFS transporter permease subunit [Alphaproteobacteria bacterium]MDP6874611.1 DHA2 family efflux MFS transporter permease subunit [Alphaproteobacteria bacterium]
MQSPAIEALFARFGPRYRYYVTFTAMLGTAATALMATMTNVAVPVIMGAFGVGQDKVHWISTGFIAAMTISMLLSDWCVRAFGMKVTYIGAMAVFIFGGIMGGLSNSIDLIIVARVLQGAGAGIGQPLAMVLILQVFPVEWRGRAMGLMSVGIMAAPAVGPAIGGVLLDSFNWQYVFFMSAPVPAVGIILAMVFMPGGERRRELPAFDWTGLVLVSLCIACSLTGLSSGQREGWGAPIISVLFSIGIISGAAFIFWQLVTPSPLLQVRVFANRRFSASIIVGLVLSLGFYGAGYLVPVFVQTVQGYSPTRSGLLMIPGGVFMMLILPIWGRLSDKLPSYQITLFGLGVYGCSSLLMMQAATDTGFWVFVSWLMLGRLGQAAMMPTLMVTAVSTLKQEYLSQGAGALNFMRNLGGAVGVNMVAVLLGQRTAFFSDAYAGLQTPDNSATQHFMLQFAHILNQLGWPFEMTRSGVLYLVGRSVHSQASMMAFKDVFLFIALAFFAAMIPALLLRETRPKPKARPVPAARTG